MKVICNICKNMKELTEEEIKKLVDIMSISNQKIKSTNYTRLLNMIEGNTCTNEKEHVYSFHNEFDEGIVDIIEKHQKLINDKAKLDNLENSLKFLEENLENELNNVKEQLTKIPDEKNIMDNEIIDLKNIYEKMTGTTDFSIFSMD